MTISGSDVGVILERALLNHAQKILSHVRKNIRTGVDNLRYAGMVLHALYEA